MAQDYYRVSLYQSDLDCGWTSDCLESTDEAKVIAEVANLLTQNCITVQGDRIIIELMDGDEPRVTGMPEGDPIVSENMPEGERIVGKYMREV